MAECAPGDDDRIVREFLEQDRANVREVAMALAAQPLPEVGRAQIEHQQLVFAHTEAASCLRNQFLSGFEAPSELLRRQAPQLDSAASDLLAYRDDRHGNLSGFPMIRTRAAYYGQYTPNRKRRRWNPCGGAARMAATLTARGVQFC